MISESKLYEKYNVPTPRYTSYPTVPHWDEDVICREKWRLNIRDSFKEFNDSHGISLYIHLPYCESLCTYCGCNTRITVNHKVEEPYIAAVLKEFDLYIKEFNAKPKIREIHLGGGTPTFFSSDNLVKLINGIKARSIMLEDAELSFEAHPANTTIAHLKDLYEVGFRRLSLGIQDFDPNIQKLINRRQTVEEVQTVLDQARALGYKSINFDVIYGLPQQTLDSVKDTISKVIELKPDRIAYYSYAHVPWKHKGQRAYDESDLPSDQEKRQLYEYGKSQFDVAGYLEIGMDHFSLKDDALSIAKSQGELHRNFMGYIPVSSKFLIGLGVSAISDIHFAYAQNKKVVEDYIEQIDKNKLPVFKGHFMSEKDIKVKDLINELMCNERVDLKSLESFSKEDQEKIHASLKAFEDEKLITLNGTLELLPIGKKFIRNIAACFDYRLWQTQKNKETFSKSI